MNGIKINGLSVNRVNIQNSTQLFENQITGAEGVLCHEFLHSLGYPDLYRNDRTGIPVGLWDIMASDSVFFQYPLAYHRAKISKWLESEDITAGRTYTLYPVSSDNGNHLYLLKTQLSDTEFFVVEYIMVYSITTRNSARQKTYPKLILKQTAMLQYSS